MLIKEQGPSEMNLNFKTSFYQLCILSLESDAFIEHVFLKICISNHIQSPLLGNNKMFPYPLHQDSIREHL